MKQRNIFLISFAMIIFFNNGLKGQSQGIEIGQFKQEISRFYTIEDGLPSNKVLSISILEQGSIYVETNEGAAVWNNQTWKPVDRKNNDDQMDLRSDPFLKTKQIASVAVDKQGDIAVAAESGLFLKKPIGEWESVYPLDNRGRSWALTNVKGVAFDEQDRLWFASTQGVGCFNGDWTLYTGEEGLPYNDFTCLEAGIDGSIWFGTAKGAIRFDGEKWSYRQGRRWLPHDTVNDIAVDSSGDAWFATPSGVGVIERIPMTLAEKAEYYEMEIEKYIKRTKYGYLSEVRLKEPGDKSEIIHTDSDNDGLWTSMYGAGECFAYAATNDPKAKSRARKVFEALRFLGDVTQGGEVEQQPGFVARTIIPTSEPNPNLRSSYSLEGMRERRKTQDALWKVYYPRWPLGKDGEYWYKTDTSSDELDGHYFFYALYYDLAAESEEEKQEVREVVRQITDHLIRNNYCLVDHDGKPTRWAVFAPDILNHNPIWFPERGLNSLSMLSYLTVAEYVTGDSKYGQEIQKLCEQHSYDINAMIPKFQRGIGSGNQSDDEMAFMGFYNLIRYTNDERLRKEMLFSFYNYWILEFPEMNPFFNFAYAACASDSTYKDPWGTYALKPWDGWLEDSISMLKDFPLDRLNWPHENSHRLDIERLLPQNGIDLSEPMRRNRGYRMNGKVLPVSERHFNHWNTDPWTLNYGGDGKTLASGTVFLLPYYMGLYHEFIK